MQGWRLALSLAWLWESGIVAVAGDAISWEVGLNFMVISMII